MSCYIGSGSAHARKKSRCKGSKMGTERIKSVTAVLLSLAALLAFALGSCGSEGGGAANADGAVVLNFAGAAASHANARAAAAVPADETLAQLTYTVRMAGAVTVTAGPTAPGEQRLTVSAPAGSYTLTVTASLNGKTYAEGKTAVTVETGKTTSARVQMTLKDGSGITIDYFDFSGSSLAAFDSWLAEAADNDKASPYNVKLTLGSLGGGATQDGSLGKIINSYRSGTNKPIYISLNLADCSFTELTENAFRSCDNLTVVILPKNLTSILGNAFNSCAGLTTINVPNGVTHIEDSAFEDCSGLKNVNLGNGLKQIYDKAFYSCSALTEITIPAGVIKIGIRAFSNCMQLVKVVFKGNGIGSADFGPEAFPQGTTAGTDALKNLYLDPNNGGAGTYTRVPLGSNWSK